MANHRNDYILITFDLDLWPCEKIACNLTTAGRIVTHLCIMCLYSVSLYCIMSYIVTQWGGWTSCDWSLIPMTLSFFSALTVLVGSFDPVKTRPRWVDQLGLKLNPYDPIFLQCFNTVGWVIWSRKNPSPIWPIVCSVGR